MSIFFLKYLILKYLIVKIFMIYVTVLSLLEMHAAGTSGNPDVVLLCRAFKVQCDLILIYYWDGLRLAVPTGGSPCSAVLRHLRAVNALVHE